MRFMETLRGTGSGSRTASGGGADPLARNGGRAMSRRPVREQRNLGSRPQSSSMSLADRRRRKSGGRWSAAISRPGGGPFGEAGGKVEEKISEGCVNLVKEGAQWSLLLLTDCHGEGNLTIIWSC